MNNQYPAVTPAKKSTYLDLGAKAGSLGFAGANIAYRLLGKGDLRFATPGGFLQSTAASAALGGLLGAIGGAHVTKNASATNVLAVKETEDIMNQELMRACEMAKLAADMSLPLEKKPAPEAGSQPVQGMTDNSTFSPTSVGASTYAGAVDAAALAKARAAAAMALAKQAGVAESAKRAWNTAAKKAEPYVAKAKEHVMNNREGYRKALQGAGAAAVGATMYGAKKGYDAYQRTEKKASVEEEYLDKLASVQEYGVTPEEAYMAAESAIELYNDCLEKMAFAEELFADADNYFLALENAEDMEKEAAEYVPIASSTLGALAGATAGYVAAGKLGAPRNGAVAAGAAGAAALGALGHYAASLR